MVAPQKNIFIIQIACSKVNSRLKTIDLIKFCNSFQKRWLHQQVKVSRKKNLITADRKFVNFVVWWHQFRQVSPEIYHLSIEKNFSREISKISLTKKSRMFGFVIFGLYGPI